MVYPGPRPPPPDWGRAPPPPMTPPERPTTIGNITVPILLVFCVVPFLVLSTWKVTTVVERLTSRIDTIAEKHDGHMGAITKRLDEIEEESRSHAKDRFSRADQEVWCARTERANPGWRCGNTPEPMLYYNPHLTPPGTAKEKSKDRQ